MGDSATIENEVIHIVQVAVPDTTDISPNILFFRSATTIRVHIGQYLKLCQIHQPICFIVPIEILN